MKEIGRTDAGFIDGQWERTGVTQASHKVQLVGMKRLLQYVDTCIGKVMDGQHRLMQGQPLIGICPHKGRGPRSLAYRSGKCSIGLWDDCHLEVEVTKSSGLRIQHFLTNPFYVVGGKCVAECGTIALTAAAQVAA